MQTVHTLGILANAAITLGANADLVGSATSQILMNTDKFTVDGATGNTAVGGTLDIQGTIPVVGTLDDDTMATATDTTLATSESIKAYADSVSIVHQRARIYSTVGQSVSGTGVTLVSLSGISYDPTSLVSSSAITPTTAGYYLITGVVQCELIAETATPMIVYIYKDSTSMAQFRDHPSLTAGIFSGSASDIIYLNGSEDVTLRVSGDASYNVIGGTTITYLCLHLLST